MSDDIERIDFDNGKYTFLLRPSGVVCDILRYGETWPAAYDLMGSKVILSMLDEIRDHRAKNKGEIKAADGTTRKAHYGAGRQPWDDIRDAGWGPEFCAANVLKYLRRDKAPEHSLESAKVYWGWLLGLCEVQRKTGQGHALAVYTKLLDLLTEDEWKRL